MNAVISKQVKPATLSDVGKKVLVFSDKANTPAYEAFIRTVDEISGKIIEVVIKDENKEETVLQVKSKIIAIVYELPGWIKFLINLFKK
jgi:hypothetical protein